MPLGVDHSHKEQILKRYQRVRKPLMPLGVDHEESGVIKWVGKKVRKPLMPLGVDHIPLVGSRII